MITIWVDTLIVVRGHVLNVLWFEKKNPDIVLFVRNNVLWVGILIQ